MKKKRIVFALIFLMLVGFEFIIGIYFHDDFIRPFVGDVLIAIVIYSFIRIFVPQKAYWLSLAVFAFAVLVEFSQMIPLCNLLGVTNNFLRVIMGVSFAWEDIVCYAVGCLITAVYDLYIYKTRNKI